MEEVWRMDLSGATPVSMDPLVNEPVVMGASQILQRQVIGTINAFGVESGCHSTRDYQEK